MKSWLYDFSGGSLDWDNDWDTNYGKDDYKGHYRISSIAGGYLIREHQNRYSWASYDYLHEQIRQIIRPYTGNGFWHPSGGFWISRHDWTPDEGWAPCPHHDWRFSVELQEGALMAAMAQPCEALDGCLARETQYIHSRISADGSIADLSINDNIYEYGLVLSAQSLAARYFAHRVEPHRIGPFRSHGEWEEVSDMARDDATAIFRYIAGNMKEMRSDPPVPTEGLAVLLRALCNAWQMFNYFGNAPLRSIARDFIVSIVSSFELRQYHSGLFDISHHIGTFPVQVQLKADIALMLSHPIMRDQEIVGMVERNIEWINRNRWDRSEKYMSALEWSDADTTNYYECHQMWYLIATTYLDRFSSRDYSKDRARALTFLTNDNCADIDMYLHNYNTYGAFFSYRAISRDGTIQKDGFHRWKGAYEIGASLWGMALNYDLAAEGHGHLITQCPEDSCDSWDKAIFLQRNIMSSRFELSWDVSFANASYAGAITGLCCDMNGDHRFLLDTEKGLRYRHLSGDDIVIYDRSLLNSGVTYTVCISKLDGDTYACSLYQDSILLAHKPISDLMPAASLYFGVLQHNDGDMSAKNILVDNIRYAAFHGEAIVPPFAGFHIYPNPFTESTEIEFALSRGCSVSMHVYDASGARVREIIRAALPSGTIKLAWDGRDDSGHRVASGVYFMKLQAGGSARTIKSIILR